jgi:dephospho-CoA kinase
MKLIIITGMPGAGKSEVADIFHKNGYPIVVMGDVIREETRRRGLEANRANTKKIALELREKDGPGAVAKQCIKKINEIDADTIIIEGCRSLAEIDVFDDYAEKVTIVSIHTSPSTRFTRLKNRGRGDAPLKWESFRERDLGEIVFGLGGVIALSDIILINEGTIEELQQESEELKKRFE